MFMRREVIKNVLVAHLRRKVVKEKILSACFNVVTTLGLASLTLGLFLTASEAMSAHSEGEPYLCVAETQYIIFHYCKDAGEPECKSLLNHYCAWADEGHKRCSCKERTYDEPIDLDSEFD